MGQVIPTPGAMTRTGDQALPQVQPVPQLQSAPQGQSGLSQPLAWPQLQFGPQVQGSQVQAGFAHLVSLLMGRF